jgi:acetyl-CoA synthase
MSVLSHRNVSAFAALFPGSMPRPQTELDPNGPVRSSQKERTIDPEIGIWEDVNEAVEKYSHGALQQVTLYSILVDPLTSCGCFECICGN